MGQSTHISSVVFVRELTTTTTSNVCITEQAHTPGGDSYQCTFVCHPMDHRHSNSNDGRQQQSSKYHSHTPLGDVMRAGAGVTMVVAAHAGAHDDESSVSVRASNIKPTRIM